MKIGTGKGDITAFYKDAAMLGYAMFHHIMKDIETPLYARTFVFESESGKVGFVNCELGFITPSLKRGVLKVLNRYHAEFGYTNDNLMICAQHTHCAPGGYSYYALYNTAVPGFIVEVYEKIVEGIVDSIVEAEKNKRNGRIFIKTGAFEPEINISFNRSLRAYNRNNDVEPLPFDQRHLAVDRSMTLLKMVDEHGTEIGSINWFGVHTTSLSNNFYRVCSDNKGFAAQYLEDDKKAKNNGYLGIFAQGNCGDVSPKWVYNPHHPFQRGKYEGKFPDDLKSAKHSGYVQYEKAHEISNSIDTDKEDVGDRVDAGLGYVDFSGVDIDPAYTDGLEGCLTSAACMGVSMLEGSKHDGPGMHPIIGIAARGLARMGKVGEKLFARDQQRREYMARKYKAQGVKDIALECVPHRIFMANHARKFIIPGFLDETIRNIKLFDQQGAYDAKPWTPQILPLQMIRLGSIMICGFPFEITTVAGKRLKATLEDTLVGKDGIEHIVLCPYSNAYSGYITTFEEYQVQMYEAGHNVFGQWSLNALSEKFAKLGREMLKSPDQRGILNKDVITPDFTEEEIDKLRHFESLTAKREKKRREKRERKHLKHVQRMNKRVLKN